MFENLYIRNSHVDSVLYSLLVQSGYLSLDSWDGEKLSGAVSMPSLELGYVWREFIFGDVLKDAQVNSFLSNLSDLDILASNVEKLLDCMFLKLPSFDLPATEYKRSDGKPYKKIPELYYHHLVLSALIFLEATLGYKCILSNRESGDGRYDVWIDLHKIMAIFEFKSGAKGEKAETLARRAAKQVRDSRYGAELGMPVIAIGCGFAVDKSIRVSCLRIDY
ncbi:MAG: PD-(D/E)XK nuclease domain-containing protein [Clostridiales bacterium]|nr:PD-(D/E)XK nuclease domain-containing protein [Clostridiales bacterium]